MGNVYNKSTLFVEKAKRVECPRCRGVGGNLGDEDGCSLCDGKGKLWKSESGWTRAIGRRLDQSQLY